MKLTLRWRFPSTLFLCLMLSFAGMMQEAKAQSSQQVAPLKEMLNQVSTYYKVTFVFEENLVKDKTTPYKFNPSGTSLDKVMQELLLPLELKASKVDDNSYAIISGVPKKTGSRKEEGDRRNLTEPPAEQPLLLNTPVKTGLVNETLKGRVVSEGKEQPIPGVSVMIKGTRTGTITDAEGYFSLQVAASTGVLLIGHVSFIAQEVAYDSRNMLLVKLKAKANELKEVTVSTGMFKRAKENFTGSTTMISGDELRRVNSVNVLEALKVFDPAVRIPDNIQFGSDPNRLPIITLRGTNNFSQQTTTTGIPTSGADFMANYANNPNQPLFILDGFEVSLQKIYDLDINRVASFTILKDAAATAIHGSRAANGVIVVETRQPQPGKLKLSYNGMMQIAAPDLTVYDLTNAAEKLEVERRAGRYNTFASGIRPDIDATLRETYANRKTAVERGVNTDWLAMPVRVGFGQRHSIYMEGGDSYVRYGIDLGYNSITGVMKNSHRDNYTGGMNLSYRYKGLLFKNVLSVIFDKAANSNYGSLSDYAKMNSYWQPYDSNGNIQKVVESEKVPGVPGNFINYVNPLYNTTLNTVDKSQYTGIINQTNVDWLIGRGFRLTGRLQINKQTDGSDRFLPGQHTSFETITEITRKGSYTKGTGNFFSVDGAIQVDYTKQIGKHQLLNSSGLSLMQTKSDFLQVYVEGYTNDRLDQISFGNGYPPNSRPAFNSNVTRLASAYTNFNYSYDNRYNADVSIRTDGSSQFGVNKRFGTFWSAGASWNMHKEKFLEDHPFISQARLRGSIGITGDNKFQPFMGITTYQYFTDQSYRGQNGAILLGFGNRNLQWQQTLKKNIGLDLALFQNRISLSVDVYKENTNNTILDLTTPPSLGFGSYKQNLGELENKGYEFKANVFLLRNETKSSYWSVFVNGLHNWDKINKISNSLSKLNQLNDQGNQTLPKFRFVEGQSQNGIWAVPSLGIDPSNGREVFVKKNGMLTYNWSVEDKVLVGNTVPDLRGSFGTNFTWKRITAGLFFSYEYGGQLYNQTLLDRVEVTDFTWNVDRRVFLGRWAEPGDVTYFKGLADENGNTVTTPTQATSRFVQDNNFVNAESISLSYTLSEKLNKKLGLSNTRITFVTNDIKRWSAIQVERGLQYPFARNFTFNISTTF